MSMTITAWNRMENGIISVSYTHLQAIAGGISYYADFYDLDRGYPQRETPIVSAVELSCLLYTSRCV